MDTLPELLGEHYEPVEAFEGGVCTGEFISLEKFTFIIVRVE